MKPWTLPLFLIAALLAPVGLFIRFAMLAPLSLVVAAASAAGGRALFGAADQSAVPPPDAEGQFARDWRWMEIACSLWAIALLAMVATGVVPLRDFLIFLGVASGMMFLNQVRTLVAHLWENDGEPMSVTAQYLDSVNVPPPGDAAGAVGAGRPALSRASPFAAGPAVSCARRGASPPVPRAGRGPRSIISSSHRGLSPLVVRLGTQHLD